MVGSSEHRISYKGACQLCTYNSTTDRVDTVDTKASVQMLLLHPEIMLNWICTGVFSLGQCNLGDPPCLLPTGCWHYSYKMYSNNGLFLQTVTITEIIDFIILQSSDYLRHVIMKEIINQPR